jgi:hypothetical protein
MTPLVSEFVSGLRAGAMAMLTVFRKPKNPSPQAMPVLGAMPVLAIMKTRSATYRSRRKSSSSTKGKTKIPPKSRGKTRSKRTSQTLESSQISSLTVKATPALDTCPSCGLQAPATLLDEHFLGSPSHRNGPEKITSVDSPLIDTGIEAKEEDSKQSVRDLLQILVPPRAFGLRHAHRLVSPISSVVHELGPQRRSY